MTDYNFNKPEPMRLAEIFELIAGLPELTSVTIDPNTFSATQTEIHFSHTPELTAGQVDAIAAAIAGYDYVDYDVIRVSAIQAQQQDDLFGLPQAEALEWIDAQLDDPTLQLEGQIDTLSIPQGAKDWLTALIAVVQTQNQAFTKITKKFYELVDVVDPTINN